MDSMQIQKIPTKDLNLAEYSSCEVMKNLHIMKFRLDVHVLWLAITAEISD
jgi:hypothetical protein